MRKITVAFLAILLGASLFTFQIPAAADDAGQVTPQVTLPVPLTPELSADEKSLYNAVPIMAVVDDPNPSTPLRRVPAPPGISTDPERATASFSITYIPNGGEDLWGETCYTFPEEAKTAFNAAAAIWANTLSSAVPITINACWADLGSSTTLGYSGGQPQSRDFTGATQSNTWYQGSLANALNGSDLEPSKFDMHITYNRNFSWYYGTDGNCPSGQHDLVTVVLHEICHGLNFSGTMRYSGGSGSWGSSGYPNIYDVFMQDGSGTQLIDYTNPSTALGSALTSNNIWFHGSRAMAANGGQRVKMYAPSVWSSGSSYSHLDYDTFKNTANALMVYAISAGASIHDPGAITNGLLNDLGWQGSHPSCPDLYSWNGEAYQFAGALFTRTHSPESEFYQDQIINPVVPQGDTLSFLIKEIDKEVSYINSLTMYYKYGWDDSERWFPLSLLSASHNGSGNVVEAILEKDDQRVYMEPGDEILVRYALPPAGMADLEISSVASGYYLWSHEIWCEVLALGRPLSVKPGSTVTLRAYINNMSTRTLPENTEVSFFLEGEPDTPVGYLSAAGLTPGSSQWYSLNWTVPANFTPGKFAYGASIWMGDMDITWKPEYYPTLH